MDEKRAVARAYDELAEEYAARRSPDPGAPDLLARLLAAVDPGERVLDAGCGQGTPVLAALTGAARAVGLDVSREQLELAADAVPGAALVRGDVTRLPFRADSFGAATAYHSLIHVPLADHGTVLREFARVLRPGALLLVTEGSEPWEGANSDWLDTGVEMRWSIAGREATREELTRAGFDVLAVREVGDDLADDEVTKPFFLARRTAEADGSA